MRTAASVCWPHCASLSVNAVQFAWGLRHADQLAPETANHIADLRKEAMAKSAADLLVGKNWPPEPLRKPELRPATGTAADLHRTDNSDGSFDNQTGELIDA
jgi:hypothetical protein